MKNKKTVSKKLLSKSAFMQLSKSEARKINGGAINAYLTGTKSNAGL